MKGNTRKIPKTLNECVESDKTSSMLMSWAKRVRRWGLVLLWLIGIFGIIDSISAGASTFLDSAISSVFDGGGSSIFSTVMSVISSLFSYALYIFIAYCVYTIIALILEGFASIVQNTAITANLALYNTKAKSGDKFPESKAPKVRKPSKNYTIEKPESDGINFVDISTLNTYSGQSDIVVDDNEENYVDTYCPHCGKELSFLHGEEHVTCPWCNAAFKI